MQKTYETKVDGVYGVKLARTRALSGFVINTPDILREFHKTFDTSKMSSGEYCSILEQFAADNGIRITEEKPIVSIEDDRYRIDVYFKIVW